MAFLQSTLEKCKQTKELHVPLIHGLPDDIALLCLARVPRRYHHLLRCVSRRWRTLLCSEEWHSYRQSHNLEETWIYAMCADSNGGNCYYVLDPDPARRCWKRLQGIPPKCSKYVGMAFEALGKKLYLLGGCYWQVDATDEVFCYDASASKWEEAASMPTARCYFESAALDEKLYITGGLGMKSDFLKSWDIYDLNSTSWSIIGDAHAICDSDADVMKTLALDADVLKTFTLDGKIYIVHRINQWWGTGHFTCMHDPSCRTWEVVRSAMSLCYSGPTVVVDGTLYFLDENSGTKLMMWQKETEEWMVVGRFSQLLTRPPCQLVAIGRSIFVIGQGLNVLAIDLDKTAKVEGMLVTSSFIPRLESDVSVVRCKTIAI